ncbi:FxLD family lanthipeptide [Streptomyces sp. NPDC020412]|uniref:FxLD family lanthipeptide n=1 Tax=Streptomyces sp. NPDC020412 TaxID=3365073 RepID=UPI0037A61C58
MSVQQIEDAAEPSRPQDAGEKKSFEDWDLDISIVESGPEADRLIRMTDDGCGVTCESACSTTCP